MTRCGARSSGRSARGDTRHALSGLKLFAGTTEPALTVCIGTDRLVERRSVEIWPQGFGEIELGIRELPQKKVADALFAARADEKIRLGRVAHREIRREIAFG